LSSPTDLTIEEVIHAYECCRQDKRSAETAIEFEADFSRNILKIYNEVRNCTWKPAGHMCFVVKNPKLREVWASQFADRVVHHLVYNRLRPRFEPYWIATTFACIENRGTSAASDWAERAARKVSHGWSKKAYVLQADIKNFFPRIGRQRLHSLLTDRCNEDWVEHLVNEVVNVDVTQDAHFPGDSSLLQHIPYHKSLWNAEKGKGLPIGNLTSQFGANVFLDVLDQYMVRESPVRHYGRYVDDIVIMDQDLGKIKESYEKMEEILADLELELHPDKTSIRPIKDGFDFCGRFIKPYRTYLRNSTAKRGTQSITDLSENEHPGETVTSYLALARNCNSHSLRKRWAIAASKQGVVFSRNITRARAKT